MRDNAFQVSQITCVSLLIDYKNPCIACVTNVCRLIIIK